MMHGVKICGLTNLNDAEAALAAGASFLGFVFVPRSKRFITADIAASLTHSIGENAQSSAHQLKPAGVNQHPKRVGLFVDPANDMLDEYIGRAQLDLIQLHGDESPARVADIRNRYQKPIIKAIPVATPDDLKTGFIYQDIVDYLLLDAKPPANAVVPGGNAVSFDWNILEKAQIDASRKSRPLYPISWFLAGGLNPDNVQIAIQKTGAKLIDCASGVERAPGIKDHDAITRFINQAR
ncbi:MAG: phosphoribosylanthranilate isomerase [Alphaproteobacteria bacterium]